MFWLTRSHLAGWEEVGAGSPGYQSSATKNSLLVSSKMPVSRCTLFSLPWLEALCCWHVCDGMCSLISPRKPSCHSDRQIPQSCQALSLGDSSFGKCHARKKGTLSAPASPLAHSDKAERNQPFSSPGFCLSIRKTWIAITLTSQWG